MTGGMYGGGGYGAGGYGGGYGSRESRFYVVFHFRNGL